MNPQNLQSAITESADAVEKSTMLYRDVLIRCACTCVCNGSNRMGIETVEVSRRIRFSMSHGSTKEARVCSSSFFLLPSLQAQ